MLPLTGRCLFAVLLCLSCSTGLAQTTLTLISTEAPRPGVISAQRILQEAYTGLGYQLQILRVPGSRGSAMIESGQADGYLIRAENSEISPDLLKIPVVIASEEVMAYSRNNRIQVNSFADLKPYRVGYLQGIPYLEAKLVNQKNKDAAPNLVSLFRMLEAGRTELVIETRTNRCIPARLKLTDISILEPPLDKILAYHFLVKKHEALLPKVSASLEKMYKDGRIAEIQQQVQQDYAVHCGSDVAYPMQ